MSRCPFARLRCLATSALLLAVACQGARDPEQLSDGKQSLCAVCEGAVVEVNVAGSLPGAGAPIGTARCILAEDDVYWTSDVRIPRQGGARACLSSEGYDYCTN